MVYIALSLKQRCFGPSPLGCANTIVLIGNVTYTPMEPLDLTKLDCSSIKAHSNTEVVTAVAQPSPDSSSAVEDSRPGFKLELEVYGAGKLAVGALALLLGALAVRRLTHDCAHRHKARSA